MCTQGLSGQPNTFEDCKSVSDPRIMLNGTLIQQFLSLCMRHIHKFYS